MIEQYLEKYPSWPKGLPWKGSRSLIAARGFKSLLLRSSRMTVWNESSRQFFSDRDPDGYFVVSCPVKN